MSNVLYWITIVFLWLCVALNFFTIIRNWKEYKRWKREADRYFEARMELARRLTPPEE